MKVTIKSRIKKLQTIVEDRSINYISETYINYLLTDIPVDFESATTVIDDQVSDLGYYDIINSVGKPEKVYLNEEVGNWFANTPVFDQILNAKIEPKPRSIKTPTTFELIPVSVTTLSNDTVDQLMYMFPNVKVTFGVTVQLQSLLPLFKEYNRSDELRKKDLSTFLLKTGVFIKTPTGLYTYVNSTPLSDIEKQFTEEEITEEHQPIE